MSEELKSGVSRAVEEAAKICGSASALARAVDVSSVFISRVIAGEKDCSLELAIEIEKATHGRVRVERLCPKNLATIEYLARRVRVLEAA